MNYWITTDTHFGHDKLINLSGRPNYFEIEIMRKHKSAINGNDVLIHLGDFCVGNDIEWHSNFMEGAKGKKWLIKGNHDSKSNAWYLDHGWHFVGETVTIKMYGKTIMLSHTPQADNDYDINIHGHFHNGGHHEHEFTDIMNSKHKLIMLEHEYKPVTLKSIIKGFEND